MQRDLYEKSIDLYGEDKYVEAFHTLLDHLNPEFRTKYGNTEGTEFHLPHGSIVVNVRIDDKMMYIDADFLNLPEKGRVAMLRQVADMNINRLLLPRFTKEGDRLKMEYHCLLSESHPHKIVTILQNILPRGRQVRRRVLYEVRRHALLRTQGHAVSGRDRGSYL